MEPADQAKLYTWDYTGAYDPKAGTKRSPHTETFSVGVFQWLPTADGRSLKRGPVKWRAKGHISNPEPVHEAARRKVAQLNARAQQQATTTDDSGR